MRGFSLPWRRKRSTGRGGTPTWQDTVPLRDGGPGESRYLHIPEIDRWRAVPFDMLPPPERGAVLERVQGLVRSLEGAVDEGTGASLDNLIESWAGSWIATVESEYVDHCAVISIHRGQARQWQTEATVTVEHEREKLDHIRADYMASRQRLTGEASGATPDPQGPPRQDWTAPHLVAGRSLWGVIAGAILILIGAMADTIAFHNVLDLVLHSEQDVVVWVMAVGTTCMGLVSAGTLGVARAIRRRGKHWPPRYRPSKVPLVVSTVVWLGLGLAMFLIRWQDTGNGNGLIFTQTSTPGSQQSPLWQAVFFAAIYLISGACAMFEAERLYNPEYFAFRRLRKQYGEQAKYVAKAEAERDRAEAALELHDGELQREDQRRVAAIADRKALGAEAANYARVLMASMLRDPAKTGITETGPVPMLPAPLGAGSAAGGAGPATGGGGTQAAGGTGGTP